VSELP
jgi:hypothetical protein